MNASLGRTGIILLLAIGLFLLASVVGAFVAGFALGYFALLDLVPPGFSLEEMLTSPGIESGPLSNLHFATAGILFIANGLAMAGLAILAARWTLGESRGEAIDFRAPPAGLVLAAMLLLPLLLLACFIAAYGLFGIEVPAEVGLDLTAVLPWAYVAGLVVAAPLGEEIAFRGYLQGGVAAMTGRPDVAIALSGLVWALVHIGQGAPKALALIPVGLALGYLRARTQSLWPGLFGHMAMNAAGLAYMVWLARDV